MTFLSTYFLCGREGPVCSNWWHRAIALSVIGFFSKHGVEECLACGIVTPTHSSTVTNTASISASRRGPSQRPPVVSRFAEVADRNVYYFSVGELMRGNGVNGPYVFHCFPTKAIRAKGKCRQISVLRFARLSLGSSGFDVDSSLPNRSSVCGCAAASDLR